MVPTLTDYLVEAVIICRDICFEKGVNNWNGNHFWGSFVLDNTVASTVNFTENQVVLFVTIFALRGVLALLTQSRINGKTFFLHCDLIIQVVF